MVGMGVKSLDSTLTKDRLSALWVLAWASASPEPTAAGATHTTHPMATAAVTSCGSGYGLRTAGVWGQFRSAITERRVELRRTHYATWLRAPLYLPLGRELVTLWNFLFVKIFPARESRFTDIIFTRPPHRSPMPCTGPSFHFRAT
jgi:hypothetical protein